MHEVSESYSAALGLGGPIATICAMGRENEGKKEYFSVLALACKLFNDQNLKSN